MRRDASRLVAALTATMGDAAFAGAGVVTGLVIRAVFPATAPTDPAGAPATRMAGEASFISVRVILALLAGDCAAVHAGRDLMALFQSVASILPLAATALGFLPGCGPQMPVGTLFVNGAVPFPPLVAGAIPSDGDALPGVRARPRAAVWRRRSRPSRR